MSLVAVLHAREPADDAPLRALLRFGALPLLEYQARQAMDLGASRIVIFTQSAEPALPQLVDRLTARGRTSATLARDLPALSRHIAPDDEVLLIADGLVVPQGALAALAGNGAAHLLVVPMVEATAGCERIDPRHGWAGAARLQGRTLLDTLDMLGDWDLQSTLVRAAVQQGARRVELSPELVTEGRLAVLSSQTMADVVFQALGRAGDGHAVAADWRGLDGWISARAAPPLATLAMRRQLRAGPLHLAGLGLGALALLPALLGWPVLALLLALAGLALGGVARAIETLSRDDPPPSWQRIAALAPPLLLLAIIARGLMPGWPGALPWLATLAPAMLCGLALLAGRRGAQQAVPAWAWPTPAASLLVLLGGTITGWGGAALLLISLCAAATLAAVLAAPTGEDAFAGLSEV